MTDNPYQLMARQFVDMWQKQLSDMLVDENFVANVIDLMHQSGGFPHAGQPNAASAAHAPLSPDAANAVVGQLERRLASTEARIAELEREMAGLRRDPAAGQRGAAKRRQSGTGAAKHKPA